MGQLSDEEVGQRLKAARALRGYEDQMAFARLVHQEFGIGIKAYGEYERGQRTLQRGDRLSLAEKLKLPETWFTEPLEKVIAQQAGQLDELKAKLDVLLKQLKDNPGIPTESHWETNSQNEP